MIVLIAAIISGFVGEVYGDLFYGGEANDYYRGFTTGFSIGFVSAAIEVFYVRSQQRSWIRRVAFLPGFIVRILALTLLIRLCLTSNELLSDYLQGRPLALDFKFSEQLRDTLFSMAFVIFFLILTQFTAIIGFKRFINLVVGRYFRPVSEDRIFLFVDVVDSTNIARKLGNERFHNYLSDIFYEFDQAITQTGGEIVSYVGDAVIGTWPLGTDTAKNSRPLLALRSMLERMELQSSLFESNFSIVPEFRAALHGGTVVVGECGDSKRQVTFLGDVVNVTARIESFTKEIGQPFLASEYVITQMELPSGLKADDIGMHRLKGVEEPFRLINLRFT